MCSCSSNRPSAVCGAAHDKRGIAAIGLYATIIGAPLLVCVTRSISMRASLSSGCNGAWGNKRLSPRNQPGMCFGPCVVRGRRATPSTTTTPGERNFLAISFQIARHFSKVYVLSGNFPNFVVGRMEFFISRL